MKEVTSVKEIQLNLSQAPTNDFSELADTTISASNNTPPNSPPNSLPDLVTETVPKTVDGADCPGEEDDEEMPPLEDIDH